MFDPIQDRNFTSEFVFATSRSSGPGGQNVNKVNTKVELRFSIEKSQLLTDEEKQLLLSKLATRITTEGELIIVAQTDRSQMKNKLEAIDKFYEIVRKALTPRKRRRATRPTLASKERRLQTKKQNSEIKNLRRKPD